MLDSRSFKSIILCFHVVYDISFIFGTLKNMHLFAINSNIYAQIWLTPKENFTFQINMHTLIEIFDKNAEFKFIRSKLRSMEY